MKCLSVLAIGMALCSVAFAQQQQPPNSRNYVPVVPSPSMNSFGGGFGYGGVSGAGTTVAGSAMSGMASVISAQGDYNLATSAAAVNLTQAQSNEIQNRQQYANTYYDMRAQADAERIASLGPPPSMEKLARIARTEVPQPLSHGQVDPFSGRVNWPQLLTDDVFSAERNDLGALVAKQTTYGSLGLSDTMQARNLIESMNTKLKSQIRNVPAPLYSESKSFLQSLIFAMTKSRLG